MQEYAMRIAICDDNPDDLALTARMTRDIAAQEHIACEVVCYPGSAALLQAIADGAVYHTLLLEAALPDMSGIGLAATLRRQGNSSSIVFISASKELALQGYEVAAARFLAKPLEADKLQEALLHCLRTAQPRPKLTLPTTRGMRTLAQDDIVYVETWGRGVRVVLSSSQEEVSMKISALEALLPPSQFVLCHRSVLVNLAYVRYLRYCEMELTTGGVLPVSKYRQHVTREKLMRYQEG